VQDGRARVAALGVGRVLHERARERDPRTRVRLLRVVEGGVVGVVAVTGDADAVPGVEGRQRLTVDQVRLALRLERGHPGRRVREGTVVGPVVARALATVGQDRGDVDRVLVLGAGVHVRAADRIGQRDVELGRLEREPGAVSGGQVAVLAVVDQPTRAADRDDAAGARVGGKHAVVGRTALALLRRGRPADGHARDEHAVVAAARFGQDLDQQRVTVEVRGTVAPLLQVPRVHRLQRAVEQRRDAQDRAVAGEDVAAQERAVELQLHPRSAGDVDQERRDDLCTLALVPDDAGVLRVLDLEPRELVCLGVGDGG